MTAPAGPSEFYLRKRRLAFVFAGLSVGLLLVNLAFGFFLESYARPRVTAGPDGFRLLWTSRNHDEETSVTRVLDVDLELKPRGPVSSLGGDPAAVVVDGDEAILYVGSRYSVTKGGTTIRGASLEQPWDVEAALPGWIFGAHGGKVVARRRVDGVFGDTIEISPGEPERLVARGPLLAWRERDRVRVFFRDGTAFQPRAEFPLGAGAAWDVALQGPRVLLVSYDREDRSFDSLGLRVRCCETCPEPRPEALVRFGDPTLLLGKLVTGVACAAAGERLAVFVTRQTEVQAAWIDEPRLRVLHQEPRGRHLAGFLFPFTMLFFSFSLVSLGFTLLRERNRLALERAAEVDGPRPASIVQRAMAFTLDVLLALPLVFFITFTMDLAPDAEPGSLDLLLLFAGVQLVLGLAQEAIFGRTLGKGIVGLKVVEADGSRLRLRSALLRNLTRPLDASFPLGMLLGMSVLMATKRRQRPGDLLAKTVVVEDRILPPRA